MLLLLNIVTCFNADLYIIIIDSVEKVCTGAYILHKTSNKLSITKMYFKPKLFLVID